MRRSPCIPASMPRSCASFAIVAPRRTKAPASGAPFSRRSTPQRRDPVLPPAARRGGRHPARVGQRHHGFPPRHEGRVAAARLRPLGLPLLRQPGHRAAALRGPGRPPAPSGQPAQDPGRLPRRLARLSQLMTHATARSATSSPSTPTPALPSSKRSCPMKSSAPSSNLPAIGLVRPCPSTGRAPVRSSA